MPSFYGLKQTGLRFFTVYGPWGRPDMAYWTFTDAMLRGKTLPVFGKGALRRDFTYVERYRRGAGADRRAALRGDAGRGAAPRLQSGQFASESIMDLIGHIERSTGRKAQIAFRDGPPGDVVETYADIARAARDFGFAPKVSLADGISRFVDWFRRYHRL